MIDTLADTPDNPLPQGAVAGTFTTRDRKTIRYGLFPAQGRPLQGTVVILTGRNESIEKYYETIGDFSARGLGVAIMDWRGQGASQRMLRDPQRGYVRSFDDYAADLWTFFDEVVLPDCRGPFYILAHSMGGLVALLAAPKLTTRVRRMVLASPLVDIAERPLPLSAMRRLSTLACWLGLGSLYISGGPRPKGGHPFEHNQLTSDPVRYARNNAIYDAVPELTLGGPTIGWMRAATRAVRRVDDPAFLATIHIPTLIIAAGADEVVSTPAIERLAGRMKAASLLIVDGAQHELPQEADIFREQFLAAFFAFVPGEGATS